MSWLSLAVIAAATFLVSHRRLKRERARVTNHRARDEGVAGQGCGPWPA